MSHDYEFYTTKQYFSKLHTLISNLGGGDKVALATMAFDPDAPATRILLDDLHGALRRGADVRLIVDAMPFLLYGGVELGPLYFGTSLKRKLKPHFAAALEPLEVLEKNGGQYAIINRPSRRYTLPVGGRSHIKFAVINHTVFVGGCNLDSAYEPDIDLMASWTDGQSAEWLGALADRLMESGHARRALNDEDSCLPVDEHTAMLVDAGVRRRSLIMRKALGLIDEAREYVFITCQFFPGQVTGQRLRAAHRRGVKVCIVYGGVEQHDWYNRRLQQMANAAERLRLPSEFFIHAVQHAQGRIHAKVIATERGAIIGSHNYVSAGVRLGTAELALLSDDPQFGQHAIDTILAQLGDQAAQVAAELPKMRIPVAH